MVKGDEGAERALLSGLILCGGGPRIAPLGRSGCRNVSAGAPVGSSLVSSASVSAKKDSKHEQAHWVVFALLVLLIPTAVGSKVYPVSNRLIVETVIVAWDNRT